MIAPRDEAPRAPIELAAAVDLIDFAWRNSRVLARNTLRSIDLEDPAPPDAIESVRLLADATRALDRALWEESAIVEARGAATRAAVLATAALADTANLSVRAIVSQVRSIAVDLLRGSGMNDDEALAAVRAAIDGAAPA